MVGVLRAHGTKSAAVAEQGCWVISNLAVGNAANVLVLVAAGACEGE